MLDFSKISQAVQVVVPVMDNKFIYNKKSYTCKTDDGWWEVTIEGNKAKTSGYPCWDIDRKKVKGWVLGYTYNNSLVFQNFDVAKRKWKLGQMVPLNFNQATSFEAVSAIVWEDGKAYYVQPNYADYRTAELKDLLEAGGSLEQQKGITPELQTLFLFHALEQEQLRNMQEEVTKAEEHERMMQDIPYRLNVTLKRSNAELLNYSISGNRIVFDWKILHSSQRYNSVIDKDTWMVLEAGYCMSNDDRRHNVTSLVKTAELYEENRLTYITRRDSVEDFDDDRNEDW